MELTQEIIRELINYDPETGDTFWKKRDVKWFKNGVKTALHTSRVWNNRFAGKKIGSISKSHGYLEFRLFYDLYLLHRVIWLYMTGSWPNVIDHKDGNRLNNVWENLDNVTYLTNARNQKLQKNNTSGYKGVSWSKRDNNWEVHIRINKRSEYLGSFDDILLAFETYAKAAKEAGFTDRHIYGDTP